MKKAISLFVLVVAALCWQCFAPFPLMPGDPAIPTPSPTKQSSWSLGDVTNATLVIWLRMDELSGHANGDVISNWIAKIGINATNYYSDGGHNPYYTNIATGNNWPGLVFNGTANWLETSAYPAGPYAQPTTTAMRLVYLGNGGSIEYVFDNISVNSADSIDFYGTSVYGNSQGGNVSLFAYSSSPLSLVVTWNAASSAWRRDNDVSDSTFSASPGTTSASGLVIGAAYGPGSYFKGIIVEYALWNGTLSDADKARCLTYLNAR